MSVAPTSISNTNSFALTTGLQRRAWKRPTCTRMKRCSGAYGAGGMQALDPLDQWQGRGRIKQAQTRPNRLVDHPADRRSASYRYRLPAERLGGILDCLLANCLKLLVLFRRKDRLHLWISLLVNGSDLLNLLLWGKVKLLRYRLCLCNSRRLLRRRGGPLRVRCRCHQYKSSGAESRSEKIDTVFHIFVFTDFEA